MFSLASFKYKKYLVRFRNWPPRPPPANESHWNLGFLLKGPPTCVELGLKRPTLWLVNDPPLPPECSSDFFNIFKPYTMSESAQQLKIIFQYFPKCWIVLSLSWRHKDNTEQDSKPSRLLDCTQPSQINTLMTKYCLKYHIWRQQTRLQVLPNCHVKYHWSEGYAN